METRHIKHPFHPIIDKNSKILILGSVPSIKSCEQNFYYMHPQNRFWKLISNVLNIDLVNKSSKEKEIILLNNNIALYDTVVECDIEGSSDVSISNVKIVDIYSLLKGTNITMIFCNGNASYRYLIKGYPNLSQQIIKLPSTSPANASYSLDKLIKNWETIKNYL